MVGRIIANPLTIRIGEKRALYCYLTIALALEVSAAPRTKQLVKRAHSSFPRSLRSGSPTRSSGMRLWSLSSVS